MKGDRKTKNELIKELESIRRKVNKMETLREKYKHTQQDITEGMRLQEESDASEDYYRGAFETSQDGLLVVHRSQGDILNANAYAQKLLGYSKEEFSKNKLWGIGVVKDDKDFQEALSRLEKDGVVYYNNISVKNKAGLTIDTEVILVDKVKFIQCNIRDNTARKRAEEQLRQSEERFRLIAENATDLIAVLDLEGKRIYSSPSYKSILGDPESLRGTDSFQEIHPEDREKIRRIFQETVRTGIGQRSEYRFLLEDGSVRYIESQGSVIRDENGNTIKVVVVSRDVTKRKQAEEELKKSEGKFRAIFNNASDGMFLVDLNARKFFMCNAMCMKMLGYTQEEFLNLDIDDIHPSEDLAFINDQIGKFSKGEEGLRSDIRFKRKEGSIFFTDLRPAILTIAEKKYLLINFHDITERKQSEEELKESNALIEAVVENVPLMIFLKEATDLRFVVFNRAGEELLGYDRKDLLGKNNLDLFPPEQAAHFMAKDREVLDGETGMLDIPEEPIMTAKKGQRLLHTRKICIKGTDGVTKYLLGISDDITERKRAEKQITLLAHTLKSVAECVSITDLNDIVLFVNNAFLKTYGYTENEILGKNINVVRSPNNPPIAASGIHAATLAGGWSGEIMNRTKDGREFPVSLSTSFVRDEKGQDIAFVGIATDITERKRAEEELKKSGEKYRSIFENVQDVYYETLLDGTILEVSPSVKLISKGQYNRTDLIGKSMYEFYPNTNDRDTLLAAIQKTGSVTDFEVRLKNRDGSFIPCSISATIKFDAEGRPEKIIGSMHDITERKRAEEALRETTDYLENLLSFANAPIMVWDNNNKITKFNLAFERLTKYTMYDVLGKNPVMLFSYDKRKEISTLISRISNGKNLISVEMPVRCKDGSVRTVLWNTANIYSADSKTIIATITHGQDITERKQAEEALQESEQKLRLVFENVFDGLCIFEEADDPIQRRLIDCNEHYAQMAGRSREELLKLGNTQNIAKSLSEDNTYSIGHGIIFAGRFSWIRPDGKDNIVEYTAVPLTVKEKRYTISIDRDITERKRAEEALQESELRFRSLYENATIGLYRTTPDGKILLANPALVKMLGFESFEKIVERNLEQNGFDSTSQRKEFLEKIEREGEVNGYDSKWIRQDGTVIFILESARAIRNSQGKTLYYDGTVENITERKLLEDQIRQMQKLESLGTLAGGIAHDFNNILGIILAFITSIKRFKDDAKKLALAVDTIITAVDRGKTLVKQILTFARKSETEFSPVDVNDLVVEIMTMIQETFPKVLTYSQNCDNAIPFIIADRSQLHQALLNLCVNARDAMSSGGVLTINTRMVSGISLRNQHPDVLASSYVCIEVGDTGEGITDEIQQKIFEPFFTTKEKGKGTGLGLAVVFGVVKTHKGFVEVESELGKGTTFRLYLPVPSAIMPAPTDIQENVKEIPGGTETVLVVEDEETLMAFIQISLAAKGYTVLSAADGPEAVKIYRERQKEISMVFTDLGLPGMTGVEEINLIKKINPDVKIIVATGFLDPEMKSELLKAGVKKFILKPYTFEEILKLTREVLDEK
ncbi:MAG: PAS domain S-box protein [Ignavibacteriales bacterium]|nr:PAS domain S-box protein [Ignavibacteriales bacterium]